MQIVIIGTGNVATVLGQRLKQARHEIVQVYGRNGIAAGELAAQLGGRACANWSDIHTGSDCYIVALSDKALVDREVKLQLGDRLVVHTAGAVPMMALEGISSSYGVFYPLQSIRRQMAASVPIPFLIDGNRPQAKHVLAQLAQSIGSTASEAGDEKRLRYHVSAVMANNFTNYLLALVQDYCDKEGLEFSNLLPLMDETVSRIHRNRASDMQTGPARREDLATIQSHLGVLKEEPGLYELYKNFSELILHYPWPQG